MFRDHALYGGVRPNPAFNTDVPRAELPPAAGRRLALFVRPRGPAGDNCDGLFRVRKQSAA